MVQSTSEPLLLRHKISDLPSPLKSPIPATFHELSGATALPAKVTPCEEVISDPLMVQSTSVPFWLRHKKSEVPSPLKSPKAATLQVASGAAGLPPEVTMPADATCGPLRLHTASPPPRPFCH